MVLGGLFAGSRSPHLLVWAKIAALLCTGMSQALAQSRDASCATVLSAITRLREQSWVHVLGRVTQGAHPEGYTRMESILLGRHQQVRVLDGTRFTSMISPDHHEERDRITGAADLLPDSPCLRVELDLTRPSPLIEYTYSTIVARTEAYFTIGISPISGLPVRVHVNGPQLSYRRSLSRPGKPPQVMLGATGLRYTEILEYSYSVRPADLGGR